MALSILSPSDQVIIYLREQLLTHRWIHELPGTPSLASELGVDRKCLITALNQLEEEGLLKSQGSGRPRLVTVKNRKLTNALKICIIRYDFKEEVAPCIIELIYKLKERGHVAYLARKSLLDLQMDISKVARYIENEPADLWVPLCASEPLMKWFAEQEIPVFAIFGRRREVKIGSIGPDKSAALLQATRKLISLGHRRISYLVREERRFPTPGFIERLFLKELESHGIVTSPYNMPNWEESAEGFNSCIDNLFKHTPPTALICDEAQFLIAASHRLSQSGIISPRDVSLICQDYAPSFDWCLPKVSHISWDTGEMVNEAVKWIEQFSHGKNKREPIYTSATFVEGETIGPPRH
jgi:DNA-binding transcriptional regulator YhcF (GntR family)